MRREGARTIKIERLPRGSAPSSREPRSASFHSTIGRGSAMITRVGEPPDKLGQLGVVHSTHSVTGRAFTNAGAIRSRIHWSPISVARVRKFSPFTRTMGSKEGNEQQIRTRRSRHRGVVARRWLSRHRQSTTRSPTPTSDDLFPTCPHGRHHGSVAEDPWARQARHPQWVADNARTWRRSTR